MTQKNVDLAGIFEVVTQTLAENEQSLNQADEYNHDHGNNMVQTFQTITNSLQAKKKSTNSAALKYASRQLSKNTNSSSGKLYAQHLSEAAGQFKGKSMDEKGALQLLQSLIGAGQSPSQPTANTMGDVLGSLLAGQTSQPQGQAGSGDLLGSLLGGLTGTETAGAGQTAQNQGGLDMGDLLNAGMAFFQAKQSGGSTPQALVQAFMAGSGMGTATHREQSTQMVVNSFLQALSSTGSGKQVP